MEYQSTAPLTQIEKEEIRKKTASTLLYVAIGSMVMLFAGLTSAYLVRQATGHWLQFSLPQSFYFSTAVIMLSSLTLNWGYLASKKDNQKTATNALLLTLILATLFIVFQFMGWNNLVEQKVFFAGKESNAAGSFMYVLTGLHLAHFFGGYIYLVMVLVRSKKGLYSSTSYLDLKLCSIYWHFLDLLWIYLFLFLLFIR